MESEPIVAPAEAVAVAPADAAPAAAAAPETAAAVAADMEQVKAKILRQVEFYFSDSNLPQDKFLNNLLVNNPEKWIDLAVIVSFRRMQALSTDVDFVASVLREHSTLLEVSAEKPYKIRRPSPVASVEDLARSVYIKFIPEAYRDIDKLTEFFSAHGKVLSVRLRRDIRKHVKNSAFVEFSTAEEAKAVIAQSKTLVMQEFTDPLFIMNKGEYAVAKEAKENRLAKESYRGGKNRLDAMADKIRAKGNQPRIDGGAPDEPGIGFQVGTIIKAEITKNEGADENERPISWSDLKTFFNDHGKVDFTEINATTGGGMIRFKEPIGKEVIENLGGKVELRSHTLALSLVEGDEEQQIWQQILAQRSERDAGRGGRGGREGGRGGREGGRGRGRGRGYRGGHRGSKRKNRDDDGEDGDERSNKRAKGGDDE